ncbi:uncharacterized protein LOC134224242 isoform X2 [Armigeres subalbatus]|uniref:uncharacterized protein LOC134224242 isoform X2 n=1 Tax=Armigeres subalbatus TaxID=124917 RepID=UPI002ED1CC26
MFVFNLLDEDNIQVHVQDQALPIIGFNRLFTVGVTVALAYELPSISIFDIEQLLREPNSDAIPSRRKDENINSNTVETSTSQYEQVNRHSYYYSNSYGPNNYLQPSLLNHGSNSNQLNHYNYPANYKTGGNYGNYYNWQQTHRPAFSMKDLPPIFLSPLNSSANDWNSIVNRYISTWIQNHPPNYQQSKRPFFPVFGKRSIDEKTNHKDKFFLDHHRSTRHQLYSKIEKFLDTKGNHGQHCVLRALCESGQRRNTGKPDTYLKEILKAIFSLPKTHQASSHEKHRMYDEAHSHEGDCAEKFHFCQDSIWSETFRY